MLPSRMMPVPGLTLWLSAGGTDATGTGLSAVDCWPAPELCPWACCKIGSDLYTDTAHHQHHHHHHLYAQKEQYINTTCTKLDTSIHATQTESNTTPTLHKLYTALQGQVRGKGGPDDDSTAVGWYWSESDRLVRVVTMKMMNWYSQSGESDAKSVGMSLKPWWHQLDVVCMSEMISSL